ncbi:uncharacterized protein LY89DRAFT_509611 [Mollisia scopiformis]|uniref:C2H2-type domain-containing protein n=1 Tax=Mollisia scopiformis TaxID=149040 RepID=A0A194XFT1_MOLSC|nr:uncharacterized protein LY89DRAFT_509611 [Mollisia scopiformis]KUJ19001.1 hypothetical protein LY89DRAFT_509611 [Mollisia scopiformis]
MTTGRNSKSGKGAYHKSHSAHGPQTHTELFWSCCNCELSALPNPSWHDQCPKCAKVRCDSCLVEWIKVRTDLSDKYSGTGARDSTFPSSGILSPSYKLSTESGTGIDTLSVVNTEGKLFKLSLTSTSTSLCIDQPLVDKGNPLSTSTGTIGSGFAQNLISASTLSPASSKSLDVFTDNNNTPNTITDNSERSYSSDDDTEVDSDELWKSRFIRTLDHCVLAACSHDLKLAALLIRKIHTIVGNWSRNGIWSHTPGASGGEGSGASGSMIGSGFSSGGPFNHHSEKRPLDGENVSDRPTKQSKISSGTEELEMNTSPKSPTFACHFYKKDPRKFNFRTNSKYKNCPHPSIPPNALRRITDHFKNHLLSQCDRCYAIFRDARALVEHRQPCEKQSSTLKEGIDDGQWDRIKEIVKKSTRKGRQEFEKWYDIWEVLFPGITPPATPCKD